MEDGCMFCFKAHMTPLKLLDNLEKEIAQVICPQLDLTHSQKKSCNWMCCELCIKQMFTCFSFKTCCLDVEDYLRNFLNSESEINFTEVLNVISRNNYQTRICDITKTNVRLCRLCLDIVDNDTYKTDHNIYIADMIEVCLPEIKLGLMKPSIFCEICISHLKKQYFLVYAFVKLRLKSKVVNKKAAKIERKGFKTLESKKKISITHSVSLVPKQITKNLNFLINEKEIQGFENENVRSNNRLPENKTDLVQRSKWLRVRENLTNEGIKDIEVQQNNENATDPQSPQDISNNTISEDNFNDAPDLVIDLTDDNAEDVSEGASKCNNVNVMKEGRKRKNQQKSDVIPSKVSSPSVAEKSFSCTQCSYSSKQSFDVELHVLLTHRDINLLMTKIIINNGTMYVCNKCNYENVRDYHMWSHLLSHKEEKTEHLCNKCLLTFTSKLSLQIHRRSHRITKRCPYCTYTTSSEAEFNKHILVHKEHEIGESTVQSTVEKEEKEKIVKLYKCEICSFKIKQASMKKHISQHIRTNMKIRECRVCCFKTNSMAKLAKHKHSGEKKVLVYLDDVKSVKKTQKKGQSAENCHVSVKELDVCENMEVTPMLKCMFCGYQDTEEESFKIHCKNCTKEKTLDEFYEPVYLSIKSKEICDGVTADMV